MFKFLLIVFTILFLAVSFTIHAQSLKMNQLGPKIDFVAQKKGTLSVQTSSGNGANQCNLGTLSASQMSICLNSNTPDTITESSAGGGSNYVYPHLVWYYNGQSLSSDEDSFTIIVTQPGIYKVIEGGADGGCWDEILITSTLPIIIPANTTLSSGDSIILNAPDPSNGTPTNTFHWYNGSTPLTSATNSTYTASQTGSYYVQTTDTNGCVINSDAVDINIEAPPSALFITGGNCKNDTLSVTDSSGLVPDSIAWFRNDTLVKSFGNSGITVAGGNGSGNGLDQLNQPNGIYLDANKNLYIADYANDRIVEWSAGASSGLVVADSISNINGSKPNDIFVDAQQNLSITTNHGIIVTPPFPILNSIYRKSFNGFSPTLGDANFASMMGDNNLNIYVCNTSNNYIERWNPYTSSDSIIGSTLFQQPTGIFVDATNNVLYLTELSSTQDNNYIYPMQVVKWDPTTNSVSIVAGSNPTSNEITWANKLAVDASGNIYVADAVSNNIQIWTDAVTQIILASGFRPKGIKLDSDGNLYVADATYNQVLEFSADSLQSLIAGSISNIQGSTVAGGNGIGSGLNQLYDPEGIFVDANKNIYIADNGNDRIVEWAAGANTGQVILDSVSRFSGYKNNLNDIWIDKNQNMFFSDAGSVIRVPLPFPTSLKLKPANAWGITGDANSNLYIAENGGVEKWNPYTNTDNLFGTSSVNQPNGICLDPAQNIYVGDNLTDSEFNYYGRILTFTSGSASAVDSIGTNYSQIGAAGGIAVDAAGNRFIADINNDRVLVWKKNAPGPVTMASGYEPWGIKLDNAGNIYVTDQTNNRIVMYPSMIKNSISNLDTGFYKAIVGYPVGFAEMTDSIKVIDCNAVLAFQLLNFTAQLQTNNVLLNWQTAQEINTSSFEIERSADRNNFASIGNVNASGNSSTTKNYSFIDQQPLQGANYYRLKLIDIDGEFTYSNIVVVNYNTSTNPFKIFPNPANNILNVMIYGNDENATLQIIDMTGRKIREQQINLIGNTFFSIDISNLAKGTYNLLLKSGSMNEQKKFEKE